MTLGKIHPRRQGREGVLKALYALELSNDPPKKILVDLFRREHFDDNTQRFVTNLFNNSVKYKNWCEEQISIHLVNWNIDRVALLDRLILQMAISEIYFLDDVPPKVSISEAIEIAKVYSTEESSSFVNGILDAVYKAKIKTEKTRPDNKK
ncbi:MAG: transcription antitermination factor NusB [Candidatus Marinimicrobia bacterium]|nr:transcription antitermination factor NusB [Candidatus Neomarinimicrobiota bacterium]